MASLIRNKRRSKLITPSNSSFSNCVHDQLFVQPLRGSLDAFKPVTYLDEQGRRHGRVSDHLLQRQIENDRQKLKKQPIPKVPVSSILYGIRNPNIAALVRDVPIENDDDGYDEDKLRADDEIKFIEYKKIPKPATSKSGARRISTVSGKQSVKFDDTTPSVNMARLVDSHLTELDDIDNVDDDDDDDDSESGDDEEDLESIKPVVCLTRKKPIISYFYFSFKGNARSKYRNQTNKSGDGFSETPSTQKDNDNEDGDDDDDEHEGIKTNSMLLDYKRSSQELQMPPTVEDIHDDDDEVEEKQYEQGESENDLSSPDVVQQRKQSEKSSEKTEVRQKSASSRPKTASTRSHTDNEELQSSRASSSTSSDDTSALLRSDNDNSPNISDNESNNEEEQAPMESIRKSSHISSNASDIINLAQEEEEEYILPQPNEKLSQRDVKGEYDPSQVIQLKESFQPIINEAASYGHLDIVRKLIEVISFQCRFHLLYSYF
jgi:hypothetical protein